MAASPQRALIEVRVTPRASHEAVEVAGDRVRVRVSSPPADGRANAAVVALLATRLGLPKRAVAIVRGRRARLKRVAIEGLAADEVFARLRDQPGR